MACAEFAYVEKNTYICTELKFNSMDIFKGYKKRVELQRQHEAELKKLKDRHQEIVDDILSKYNDRISKNGRQYDQIVSDMKRGNDVVNEELEKVTGQLAVFEKEHERVQNLLNKMEKRSRLYREMVAARDAWEAEIHVTKEEDKIKEFILWKNQMKGGE